MRLPFLYLIAASLFLMAGCNSGGGSGSSESNPSGEKLIVTVDTAELDELLSDKGVAGKAGIKEVMVYDLEGNEIARKEAPGEIVSFSIESDKACLLRAQMKAGSVLWSIVAAGQESRQEAIDLQSTYRAALVYATLQEPPPADELEDLLAKADEAIQEGVDRTVGTVRRIIDHAVLRKIEYQLEEETSAVRLRAFAGGLEPVRSLDNVLDHPQTEFIPYFFVRRILSWFLPSNILISELQTGRWDYRVKGKEGHDGGPHVVNGGDMLVFDSDRDWEDACNSPSLGIYTLPLAASANAEPILLTTGNLRCRSNQNPAWSWDQKKIAFASGFPGSVYNIYVMNADGSDAHALTKDLPPLVNQNKITVTNLRPRWSPDNSKIVYSSNRTRDLDVWLMNSDGTETVNLTESPESNEWRPVFSPDGRKIIFLSDRDGDSEVFEMEVDGSLPRQVTFNDVEDDDPAVSTDGIQLIVTRENGNRMTPVAINLLNGELIDDLGDFAAAMVYEDPVIASTPYVLVPGREVVAVGEYTPDGYVTAEGGKERLEDTPNVQGAFEIKPNPTDPLWYNRHEIFSAFPNFTPAPLSW
jgi:hypothetical protein